MPLKYSVTNCGTQEVRSASPHSQSRLGHPLSSRVVAILESAVISGAPRSTTNEDQGARLMIVKRCCVVLGCIFTLLCLLSGAASARVVTEFSVGTTPQGITAGP